MGRGEQLLRDEGAREPGRLRRLLPAEEHQARHRVVRARRRLRRTDQARQDLLLVQHRGLPQHLDAQRIADPADAGRAQRRLLAGDERGRRPGHHLRSADAPAVPGQRHSGEPDQSDRPEDAVVRPAAAGRPRQRHVELRQHGADQRPLPAGIHRQGGAQDQRQGVADRLLLVQPHQRAVLELLRAGAQWSQPLRGSERLSPEAAAADPRAQQHLGDQRQLGAGAALRLDAVRRQQHDDDRLRSVDAGLLAELPRPDQPDRRAEVPRGRIHGRLQLARPDQSVGPHL